MSDPVTQIQILGIGIFFLLIIIVALVCAVINLREKLKASEKESEYQKSVKDGYFNNWEKERAIRTKQEQKLHRIFNIIEEDVEDE